MTQFFILSLFVSLFFASTAHSEVNCKAVAENINITFSQGLPGLVNAGDQISFPLKITLKDKSLVSSFKNLPVSFFVQNGQIGTAKIAEYFFIKAEETPDSVNEDFVFSKTLGKNIQGFYQVAAYLNFYFDDTYCSEKIPNAPRELIVVRNNNSNIVDQDAPIVNSIDFDNSEYKLGDNVNLQFTTIEKSRLCTEDLKKSQACEATGHLALRKVGSEKTVDIYPKTVLNPRRGYLIQFPLQEQNENGKLLFEKGVYEVIGINVSDEWGNSMLELTKQVRKSFVIR